MDALDKEIQAFEKQKSDLMKTHFGKFVIFKDEKFVNAFDTFDAAAKEAIKLFGRGPYLIREVRDFPAQTLPASVAFRQIHAR